MKRFVLVGLGLMALGACDQDFSNSREVEVAGRMYTVAPGARYPGQWYSEPSDRSLVFSAPRGVRSANLRAIEIVSGCKVVPETIDHIDGISTVAEVRC